MNKEIQRRDGKTYERISKIAARKLWEQGKTIWLLPSNCRFDSQWGGAIDETDHGQFDTTIGISSFENMCNHFSNYNCNKENGMYIKYYRITNY